MSKYRIISPIYFDGVCFPAGTIVDTTTIPISGEALVERSWGEVYDGDEPAVASVDVLRDAMPKPVTPDPEPVAPVADVAPVAPVAPQPIPQPIPEPIPEPVAPPPVSPAPRKRKS